MASQPDHLSVVPDQPADDVYGWVPFLANSSRPPLRLTVGVIYGDDDPGTDIAIDRNGYLVRHPYEQGLRHESTEEERAAVGWTW